MNPDQKRLAFAAGAAALAFALAFGWLSAERERLLHQTEEVKVLAAKRYLPAHARLQAGDLAWLRLPRAFAPTGVVSDASAVLGLQTLVPFNPEEPLIFNKLALGEQSLAAAVPEGLRALSLPVNAVSGISGLLKPGDHVDVLLLHGQGAQAEAGLLLQDVAVLAVGSQLTRDDDKHSSAESTVTVAVAPRDAALALAALANGELHLALRAAGDARPLALIHASFGDALRRSQREGALSSVAPLDDAIPSKR